MSTDKTTDLAASVVSKAYDDYYTKSAVSRWSAAGTMMDPFYVTLVDHVRKLLRDCYYDPLAGTSVSNAAQVVVDNKMAGMVFNDVVVRRLSDEDGPGDLALRYEKAHAERSRDQLRLPAIRPLQPVGIIRDGPAKEEPPEVRPGVVVRLKSGGPKMTVLQPPDGNGVCECGWFECLGAYGPGLSLHGNYRKDFFLAASLNIVTEETA